MPFVAHPTISANELKLRGRFCRIYKIYLSDTENLLRRVEKNRHAAQLRIVEAVLSVCDEFSDSSFMNFGSLIEERFGADVLFILVHFITAISFCFDFRLPCDNLRSYSVISN